MHHQPSEFAPTATADAGPILQHAAIRRAAACRSFWSDDALNRAFRARHGETFSLKDFTAFVIAMPSVGPVSRAGFSDRGRLRCSLNIRRR